MYDKERIVLACSEWRILSQVTRHLAPSTSETQLANYSNTLQLVQLPPVIYDVCMISQIVDNEIVEETEWQEYVI